MFPIAGMILRSLFGRPATRMYPVVKRQFVPGSRGHIEIEIGSCVFCGLCERKCPTAALSVDRDGKLWEINRMRCITCNSCVETCPKKSLVMAQGYSPAATVPGETEKHHALDQG